MSSSGLLTDDEVRALLQAAAAARSSRDGRPWRVRWADGALEVHGAPEHATAPDGPDHREVRVACGAAIANARAVIRADGHHAHVQLLPHPGDPWFLGRARPGAAAAPSASEIELAAAIHRGSAHEHPSSAAPPPARLRGPLTRVARRERCWLVFPDADERRRLWALSADGAGEKQPASIEEEPAMAVVSTVTDSPVSQLQAGQATQFVLLAATVAGVSASFVVVPLEMPEVRREVRRLLGGALWPQMVLRLQAPPARSGPDLRVIAVARTGGFAVGPSGVVRPIGR